MTMDRVYLDYLEDILDALRKSRAFAAGMSMNQFSEDEKTVFAVIRALEVVGEASKQIPHHVRRRHQEVPWRQMAGMRDKLIHHYFGVDLAVLWKTIQEDVPALLPIIQNVISEEQAAT